MLSLMSLWLPILLSAVFVFVASSVIHMFIKYHNSDYGKLPQEEAVRDALRRFDLKPGFYSMPNHVGVDFNSPEYKESMARGPNGFITVTPNGMVSMGKTLGAWFLNCLLVTLFAAYVACNTLPIGADYLTVFRVTGAVAFAGFSLALLGESIWFSRPWMMTVKHMFDGLIYALLTAGTFGWLWPDIM